MNNIKKKTEKVVNTFMTFCKNNKSSTYKEDFSETVNDMNIFPCIHKTPEYNGTPQINTIIDKNNIHFNDYLKMFIHELRIPLSGISMGIYLLKNNHISDDDKNILDNMNENIVFIEDIFSKFAVIQDGNIELNVFEPFSINILFEKIKHILYCYIKSSEIELDIYISTEIYDWNYGDKYNIQHCIINLLKNAIKYRKISHKTIINIEVTTKIHEIISPYMPSEPLPSKINKFNRSYLTQKVANLHSELAGGPLRNSEQNIHKKKQTILITITDNNQQILQNIKTKLFTTFDSNSGSGLGLYICKTIVELHGGTIDHEFVEPDGNKFIITLTLDLCEDVLLQISTHINGTKFNRKMVSENVSLNVSEKSRFSVLLVDDNLLTRKLMYTVLRSIHMFKNVYMATDGADAIHKIKTYIKTLNVIFLDKDMPIMDGLHAAKEIRDMSYNQLIFGLTGHDDEIYKFIESGADYVIIKPFTDRKISLIEKFIEKYGTHRPENKIIKKVNDVLEWVVQVKNNQNSDTFIKI